MSKTKIGDAERTDIQQAPGPSLLRANRAAFNRSAMHPTSRRTFLQQLAAGLTVAPFVTRGLMAQSPNARINHATFGAGGMAWADLTAIAKHPAINVVAACDVDLGRTAEFRKKFPEARVYQDYRELLEKHADRQVRIVAG